MIIVRIKLISICFPKYFTHSIFSVEKRRQRRTDFSRRAAVITGLSISIQLSKYRASYYSGHGPTGNIYTAFGSLTRKGNQVHRAPALKLIALIWSISCCAHTSFIGKPQISGPIMYFHPCPLWGLSAIFKLLHFLEQNPCVWWDATLKVATVWPSYSKIEVA